MHQSQSVVTWGKTLFSANSTELPDRVLIDFSLTVKAVNLISITGRCSASSSAKQRKSGSIYNW